MVLQNDVAGSEALLLEQRRRVRHARKELLQQYRGRLHATNEPPIRVMAAIVQALERECAERQLEPTAIRLEIVNRTIGDVNVRLISECEGEEGGPSDYRLLADELGIALPGEDLHGKIAAGTVYRWLRDQMLDAERQLMSSGYDPRIYDIAGIGNPVLRGWLAEDMRRWGLPATADHIALGLGATDCIDKVLRGLRALAEHRSQPAGAVLFAAPGFGMPESQAVAHGFRLHRVLTHPEDGFKLTPHQLEQALDANADISVVYLTITNNPTTFAYEPDELIALLAVLGQHRDRGRCVHLLADLAYVGTGIPAEDEARMAALCSNAAVLEQVICVSSLSKTHTLTGERFGWVTFGTADFAASMGSSWVNSVGTLPGEWQLRFMAYHSLFRDNPQLVDKIRRLFGLRRARLRAQLARFDDQYHLFERIYLEDDATIYNWSKLRSGEDCFSVFEKTGIAGIPGSVFGYDDQYIRFSVGILPVAMD